MGKEGTSVFLRVRPLNQREQGTTAQARCLEVQDGTALLYTGRDAPANNRFAFDAVLGEETTQAEAFEVAAALQCWGSDQRCRLSATATAGGGLDSS